MRQKLMWLAIIIGASFYILTFFIGEETAAGETLHLTTIQTALSRAINVVTTGALGLGIINLFWIHGRNVLRRKKEWPYSGVVFLAFAAVTTCLLWQYRVDAARRTFERETGPAVQRYRAALAIDDPAQRDAALAAFSPAEVELVRRYYEYEADYRFEPLKFYLNNVYGPLVATVMALLGFYITYAAYRAFRIRSVEAAVMMLSAAIVILGSDPLGGWLSALLNSLFGADVVHLTDWADWDNRVMNSGMRRGLDIGIAVAVIAMSLRILLGLEKGLIQVARDEA